ncbi:helix-turn-helix domain-containing protein [Kordia sp.]|uniref:helix-turn-helix domain-containing protein n=1 Tax=Kordia sp. TaxID=1965332 RepID=UPI003D6BCD70
MKSSFFIPVLLFFSLNCVFGQTDSLTTKSFEELEKLYLATYKTPKEAKKYVDALCIVAKKGTDKQRIAKAFYRKGVIYLNLGNLEEALTFTKTSEKIAQQLKDKTLLFQNHILKGNVYLAKGNYTKTIASYLKAKSLAEERQNLKDILAMSYNIGLVKKQVGDYTGALIEFKQNLQKIELLNNANKDRTEAINYLGLSDTYLRMKKLDSAYIFMKQGFQKTSPEKYPSVHINLLLIEVIIGYQKKQYQQSIDRIVSLDTIIKKTGETGKIMTFYLYKAKNYQGLKSNDSAIFQYEKIKNLIQPEELSFPELDKVYFQLATLYLQKKDIKNATHNFKLFEEFTQQKDSTDIVVHHTIKDYDITKLKEKLQTVNDENTQQKKTVNYLYVISGILIACAIFFWLLYKQNKKQHKKRFNALMIRMNELESPKNKSKITTHKTDLAINDEGVEQILKDLAKFEAKQQFLHVDCTLAYTAKKLKTNTAYLSHVINTYKGKKFTAYLNELRINTALVTLKNDKKIRLYSIKAIANEFGYARRETFSKVFKSATGMDPTSYIKELQLQDKNDGDNS